MGEIEIYLIPFDRSQVKQLKAALTCRRKLLQGSNQAAVVARNAYLNRGEDAEAKRFEDSMFENDTNIEQINEMLKSVDSYLQRT